MTELLSLPGNKGQIFAVDPHKVSAVQPYEGELAGRVGKHPLCVVWVEDHNLFVCAWPMEQTLAALNEKRASDAALFGAGFWAGVVAEMEIPAGEVTSRAHLEKAWQDHLNA